MREWHYLMMCMLLAASFAFIGSAMAQGEPDDDDDDPFGGLFDPENTEAEVVLDWETPERAEFRMSMEMDLGAFSGMFRGLLDNNSDGKIDESEVEELGSFFEIDDTEGNPLELDILIDNRSAQMEFESGWTGLVGDVDSTEPIGMYFNTVYTWTLDDTLDRHTISLRPLETNDSDDDEIPDDINWTDDDDDDEGMPFDMTFVIKMPDGWSIDEDSVVPENMKQFVTEDGTIELTPEDIEAIGEPEGDIVSFDIVKGESSDSPFPLWIPVGALFVAVLSLGLLGSRRR